MRTIGPSVMVFLRGLCGSAFFDQDINEGKLCGLCIFHVENLQQRPEYVRWTKEALADLKRA